MSASDGRADRNRATGLEAMKRSVAIAWEAMELADELCLNDEERGELVRASLNAGRVLRADYSKLGILKPPP